MFVFQVGAQKNAPQKGQMFKPQVQVFTGKEALRIMQGVMPVSEQMLTKMGRA